MLAHLYVKDFSNMATSVVLIILLYCQCIFCSNARDQTTVEITLPYRPIMVGGILAISCEINNMQAGYTVKIFREFNGDTEQISGEDTYYSSSLSQRVFISKRSLSGSSTVYFMTLVDVSHADQGEYICSVSSIKNRRLGESAADSITTEIISFPRRSYPVCQRLPCFCPIQVKICLNFTDFSNEKGQN